MTEAPPVPVTRGQRVPRWLWIALVVSLAVNLLVAGMAAAAMLHFRHGHGAGYFRSLPAERRAVLQPLLAEQRALIRPLRQQLRDARGRARDVLSMEPLDRARLAQSFDEVRNVRIALEKARGDWFLKLAEKMTPAERRQFVEWRRDREERSGRGRWRRGERDRE